MSPSSPERTKVTKQKTISLKMQLFCWLWVLDLSPAKAVARCYLDFLFFSTYSQKKAMSCLPGLLDQPPTGSHLLPLLLSSLPVYSPRAAKVKPWKKSESFTPNSTVLTHKWDQYCADLIYYSLNTPYRSLNSLSAVPWKHKVVSSTRASATEAPLLKSLSHRHHCLQDCSYINISERPASTSL